MRDTVRLRRPPARVTHRWIALAVVAVLAAAGATLIRGASATTTVGHTEIANTTPDSAPDGYKFGSLVSLPQALIAATFRFYARGGSRAQTFVPLVYDVDVKGIPNSLLARGSEVTVPAGRPAGWVESSLPNLTLQAGNYVLVLLAGPGSGGASLFYTPRSGRSFWNENAFPDPSASWGEANGYGVQWAFAVDSQSGPSGSSPVNPVEGTQAAGGCPAFPAFPNKSCTGVPAGTALTTYSGGEVTQDNAVIANVRITSTITVRANNVTFRNCLIVPSGPIAIAVERGFNGLTLENCTFKTGGFIAPFSGLTLRRILVDPDPGAYRPDGIVVGFSSIGHNGQNILIEESFVSPQWGDEDDHPDGIQFWGFGTVSNVVLRHNYIDSTNANPLGQAGGAGAFFADATYENVTIENNYFTNLQGDSYIHLRLLSNEPTYGHVIRGNRFDGHGVPVDLFRMTPSVWDDNRFAETGKVIPQPVVKG